MSIRAMADEVASLRAQLRAAEQENERLKDERDTWRMKWDAAEARLQALIDFLETCLCTECGGHGWRTGQHCDDSPRVECGECLGTGHDSRKAFERMKKAEQERDNLAAKAQVMHDLHDALGVAWGHDPYARIKQLLKAEQERDALREKLAEEIGAAFEAGHWAWPTTHQPNRMALRDAYVKSRIAGLLAEPPK